MVNRRGIYKEFQAAFPKERLAEMTLSEYTNLERENSFCYWVESKTQDLGSIWGGSSYKFGIYEYKKRPAQNASHVISNNKYAWYRKYNKGTDEEAFEVVKNAIIKIAEHASKGELEAIEKIDELGDVYKWKIAFLYSNETLIPVYKRKILIKLANHLGMPDAKNANIPSLQKFLMKQKGDKDIFEFYVELLKIIKEADKSNKEVKALEKPNPQMSDKSNPKYSEEDFLNEVFMKSADYARLKSLLLEKKNIILQGAPGVGKTYSAKRLAYSIMGEKDESRIEFIQFHQNYSYEDFIMGYKPKDDGGFELKRGVFYNFCKKAQNDPDKDYFFIIDEINRGNMSKIFGELLMLIENNYRGEKHEIRLAYNDEYFFVPEKLHIIGMMNTADRSLAMIDYALRRRFSFFDIVPGFDSDGFKKYQEKLKDETFNKVIDAIKALNSEIAEDDSLGQGFCIGHSYFCNKEPDVKMWLENVIKYDIEPMLREYWFDNTEKFKKETSQLLSLII